MEMAPPKTNEIQIFGTAQTARRFAGSGAADQQTHKCVHNNPTQSDRLDRLQAMVWGHACVGDARGDVPAALEIEGELPCVVRAFAVVVSCCNNTSPDEAWADA